MQISAELRWFWRDPGPVRLKEWFLDAQIHRFDAGGPRPRVDRYFRDQQQAELGIKNRDERPGEQSSVEIKGLISRALCDLNVGPFVGGIELWTKWTASASVINFSERTSIATQKVRWLRKFNTSVLSPREIPLGKDEKPRPAADGRSVPLPDLGCNTELTKVVLPSSGETWWTFGFESFGPLQTVESSLRAVAGVLDQRRPPMLGDGVLASYPAWLNTYVE